MNKSIQEITVDMNDADAIKVGMIMQSYESEKKEKAVKIISWNVNGLRARIKAGFENTIKQLDPDIICIQETRCTPAQLPKGFLDTYWQCINDHDKAGYAGCGTWIKKSFCSQDEASGCAISGQNGRALANTFNGRFNLVNAYVPNSGLKLERLKERIAWHQDFLSDMQELQENGLPLIYLGDLNCAITPADVGSKYIKSGTTDQERGEFVKLNRALGIFDIWRKWNLHTPMYTWFSNQHDSKSVNRGMRIDYFLVSHELESAVKKIDIIQDNELVCGSDHQILLMEVEI